MSGRDLLYKGIRFQIGTGDTINPSIDPWLPSHPPLPAINHTLPITSKMKDLWQPSCNQLDETKLHQILTPEDAPLARRLYLPEHQTSDKELWHYTKKRYILDKIWLLACHTLPRYPLVPSMGDINLKNKIWKSKTSPKIKHFIWQILSKAIGTRTDSIIEVYRLTSFTKRCCLHQESTNHLFFHCEYAQAVWRGSNLPITQFLATNTIEENLQCLLQFYISSRIKEVQHAPFWILWQLWKSKNDLFFNKINHEASSVVA